MGGGGGQPNIMGKYRGEGRGSRNGQKMITYLKNDP